jgi:hypothetical protein
MLPARLARACAADQQEHSMPSVPSLARVALAAIVLALPFSMASCATTKSGLEFGMGVGSITVVNKTDRMVKVELITLDKFGTAHVYSTSLLTIDGEFKHGVDRDNRLRQMRAKFTIADEPGGSDVNYVQLNVPEDKGRDYDLKIMNGRLTARELKKGRS